MDPESPSLIGACRYDASALAATWIRADDDRFRTVLRVIPLFDSGKERVHIDMDYRTRFAHVLDRSRCYLLNSTTAFSLLLVASISLAGQPPGHTVP